MTIGVLTSSRADFGIYLPLLKELKADTEVNLELIVFGTHLSKFHGFTIDEIEAQGFEVSFKINSMLLTDDANSIATAYALTALKFADFWANHYTKFDLVITLGDRYEMAAAVSASIPFSLPLAHIHGGETTLGAIDNIYRHTITLASTLHFVSTESFKERITAIKGTGLNCFVTGALSLDNLKTLELLNIESFSKKWNIDLSFSTILITLHPETISFNKNKYFVDEIAKTLEHLVEKYQLVITMPNADTSGTMFREYFRELKIKFPEHVFLIENFGTQSYFTCMKYAKLMLGNTSSGILEAASFKKYVINIGDRQKGRLAGDNVIHVAFNHKLLIDAVNRYINTEYSGSNIYFKGNAAFKIKEEIKSFLNES